MKHSLKQLKASLPTRVTRPQGFWVPYAWLVRSIVEQSEGGRVVSDAVRTVLANEGLPVTSANERTLRVAYYGIRDKEWPIISDTADDIPTPYSEQTSETSMEIADTDSDISDDEFALDEELRLELEQEISEGFIPDPE